MMMKRKRSSSREAMERTEFSKDATRLLKEFQYLRTSMGEISVLFSVLSLTSLLTHTPTRNFKINYNSFFSPFIGGSCGGVDLTGKLTIRVWS